MVVSDTALIVGVSVFVSGVRVNGVLSVEVVGGVLSDVDSEREIVILVLGKVMVGKVMEVGEVLLSESLGVESESEMVSIKVSAIVVVSSEVSAIVVVSSEVSAIVVVSSGVGIRSPTLDTSGSSTNIPDRSMLDTSGSSINIPDDRSGVFGTRAESAK
jgi:hypothetical protein